VVAERLVAAIPCAEARLRFEGECLRRGIILYTVCYSCFAHAVDDIEQAVAAMAEALEVVRDQGLLAT
jgi:hypothetical protein